MPVTCSEDARRRIARLSRRERQVLERLSAGATNKAIGRDLAISHRTVEYYRAHMMTKIKARHVTEAIRIWLLSDLENRHFQDEAAETRPG